KSLSEAPLVMVCYDLLEWNGEDIRAKPMRDRRNLLQRLLSSPTPYPALLLSEIMTFDGWREVADFRQRARESHCEGVMLKRKDSTYGSGRRRGNWWKWKTDPRSEEHTSELQSRENIVCRLLLEKKKLHKVTNHLCKY